MTNNQKDKEKKLYWAELRVGGGVMAADSAEALSELCRHMGKEGLDSCSVLDEETSVITNVQDIPSDWRGCIPFNADEEVAIEECVEDELSREDGPSAMVITRDEFEEVCKESVDPKKLWYYLSLGK